MASRRRVGLYLLVGYALVEISVDNVLVFTDLTGRSIPSVTLLLLGLAGVEFRPTPTSVPGLSAPVVLLGVLGVALMLAAVWQVVRG